LQGGEYDFALP
jgi:hypothetical protein